MSNIVIVTRNMGCGGAERVIAQLANYFVEKGIKCTIITVDECDLAYSLSKNVDILQIGKKSSNKVIDRIKKYHDLRNVVKKISPDVVLSLPEDIGIYVIWGLLGSGIPVMVSERNNPWVMPDSKITRILRKLMYPFAKKIIFQTNEAKSFFSNNIQKKSVVLPNPVDENRIPPLYKGLREKKIVSVGRLAPQKNFDLLIEAFDKFHMKHSDYKLIIYGEGPLRAKYEKEIKDKNLQDYVLLPGKKTDVLERINNASMFVMTSNYEGMPNALIEAMCMGIPSISTNCPSGGPKELIKNGYNGFLIDVGNVEQLVDAMERLTDKATSSRISISAYSLRKQLTDSNIYKMWEKELFEF